MYKFKFADIGEGLHEGVVGQIYKKEGDTVAEGDSLFSVETDKVTSDIPAPVNGTIKKVYMATGDTIHVGDIIYDIDDGSTDTPEETKETKEEVKPEVEKKESAASVVGSIEVSDKIQDLSKTFVKQNTDKEVEVRKGKVGSVVRPNDNVRTTPLARAIAVEKGIDISKVQGSGFNGRVLVRDIETYNPQVNTSIQINTINNVTPIEIVQNKETRVKATSMRKAISKAMKDSWNNVAYTNLTLEVNMTKLWDYRQSIVKGVLEKTGTKVTLLPFIMRATAIALSEFPQFNSKYDELNDELIQFSEINLGIAVDTKAGLVVPVVKDAQNNSVVENAAAVKEVALKARDGKLSMKDITGGTFTITNYGSVGALYGVPVINFPEVAILGTGNMIDKVYFNGSSISNGKVMHLTLAADHRYIDGADIGRFVTRIKELLEEPGYLGLY